jgi:hypothetical protein
MSFYDRSIDARSIAGLVRHPLTVALLLSLSSLSAGAAPAPGLLNSMSLLAPAGTTCQQTSCDDNFTVTLQDATAGAQPGNVLANDGYAIANMRVTAPLSGSTAQGGQFSFVDSGDGTSTGEFTYTAPAGYTGADQFSYNSEFNGNVFGNAVVFMTVTPTPPNPVGDEYYVARYGTLTVPAPGVLANDTDPDGNPFTITGHGDPAAGVLTFGTDGGFTFDASAIGFDTTQEFNYTIDDGNGNASASVQVHVIAPPNVFADFFSVPLASTPTTVAAPGVLTNDVITEKGTTLSAVAETVATTQGGQATVFADGSFNYTAPSGFIGTDTFPYQAFATVASAAQTVSVQVTNTPPNAFADVYAATANSALSVDASSGVLANDTDPDIANGQTLTAFVSSNPSHGSLALSSDGSFVYTPNANYIGPDSFNYGASDSFSNSIATVSINVAIGPPNAVSDNYIVALKDAPLIVGTATGLLANDTNGGSGTLAVVASPTSTSRQGTVAVNADGSFTYTPRTGFVGNDFFNYTVSNGTENAFANVTIQVTDTLPTTGTDSYNVIRNTTLVIAAPGVLGNDADVDPGQSLQAKNATGPSHGALVLNANGSFTYVPNSGYTGPDSFTYQAYDGYQTSPGTVNLTVGAAPPDQSNVVADSYTVALKDTPYAVAAPGVLANDSNGGSGTLAVITTGAIATTQGGSVQQNGDGSFTYTAPSGFVGVDTYQYSANNGPNSVASAATVTINVTNTVPIATTDAYNTPFNTVLTQPAPGLLGNDVDPDQPKGQALSVTGTSAPAHGGVAFSANGGFTYTPTNGYTGSDSFTYTLSDGVGTATGTVNITVGPGAPPPPPPQTQAVPAGNAWTWLGLGTLLGWFGLRRMVPVRKRR